MKYSGISLLGLLIGIGSLIGSVNAQCCLKFNGVQCVTCPENMHVYRGNCIYNLQYCKAYANGFDCSECLEGYKLEKSACILVAKVEPKPQTKVQTSKPQLPKLQPPKQQQKQPTPTTQSTDYKQFSVNLPLDTSGKDQRSQRALVVDQIFRSTHTEIGKADIIKVTDRVYPDNSKIVQFIYRVTGPGKAQTLYQALMIADLDTFIFKEVSFKKVQDKPQVVSEKPSNNGASTSATNQQGNNQQQASSTTNSVPQQSNNPAQKPPLTNDNTVPSSGLSKPQEPQPNSVPSVAASINPQLTTPSVPTAQTTAQQSIITVSGGPQDEYSSIKFIQLSDMDALGDINFVIALNQINNKLPELQGLIPGFILAQLGYNTSKLSTVHYIINFEVEDNNKVISVQEVKLKVVTATSEVQIDSVVKKEPNKKIASPNSTPNTAKSPDSVVQSLSGEKLLQRQSYTEISSNPAQADIFFLIFLDNLGKGIEKKLTENGKKPGENQIVYAGRIDSKDMVNFWVETRVTCVNGTKSLFKVTGAQNKMTYEVKMNDIVPLEDIKTPNPSQKAVLQPEVIRKFQQSKDYISGSTATSVTTLTSVPQPNPTSPVVPQVVNANTESRPASQPASSASTASSSQQSSPNLSTLNQVKVSPNPPNNHGLPSMINVSMPPKAPAVVVAVPQAQTQPTAVPVPVPSAQTQTTAVPVPPAQTQPTAVPVPPAQSQLPVPQKPSQAPFSSKMFSEINETISQKAGGFSQIDPETVQSNDGVLRSIDTLLAGRPNKENLKLYKAYIKNFGIKAEYKIYLMDLVSKAPKIDIAEGYCTYDLMRKRIFVISYGLMGS